MAMIFAAAIAPPWQSGGSPLWGIHPTSWFESAKIVADIAINRGSEVQDAFDAAISNMASGCARPHKVLLISTPREVCVAALFACLS
ncbi:hypothetical protein C2134_18400 [Chromobacterium sinusclupearum]|uniref:Uncharacterized protein n=1 Tax=Chromobacterium sinusclupearum TaxID=2077146 RepID=A0A2K4MJK0_9NEIS|nr:hypothetical protein C2134_18400 [Chromobacterium sinusclupearum]